MVILDNAFGETGAKAMREEIVFLAERGLMTPNQTRFGPHEVRYEEEIGRRWRGCIYTCVHVRIYSMTLHGYAVY
jgi:hypothetical protein